MVKKDTRPEGPFLAQDSLQSHFFVANGFISSTLGTNHGPTVSGRPQERVGEVGCTRHGRHHTEGMQ